MTRPDNADESWRGVGRAMAHNPVGVNGARRSALHCMRPPRGSPEKICSSVLAI